ncbi:hypothetical protein M413DRAFT_445719 [Hebeloma cylindrosporum]|uniref:Uncharacterized protein n=1 Tax=Hebeloma cylindrosporum TaxID=76867 RepID=A0A0C2YIN2_HEBCY|nr:hypothetical protein M413DRAFT_445719 [Hebeloma cylindrosporum h7]
MSSSGLFLFVTGLTPSPRVDVEGLLHPKLMCSDKSGAGTPVKMATQGLLPLIS